MSTPLRFLFSLLFFLFVRTLAFSQSGISVELTPVSPFGDARSFFRPGAGGAVRFTSDYSMIDQRFSVALGMAHMGGVEDTLRDAGISTVGKVYSQLPGRFGVDKRSLIYIDFCGEYLFLEAEDVSFHAGYGFGYTMDRTIYSDFTKNGNKVKNNAGGIHIMLGAAMDYHLNEKLDFTARFYPRYLVSHQGVSNIVLALFLGIEYSID